MRRVGTTEDGLAIIEMAGERLPMVGGPLGGSTFDVANGKVCWIRPKGANGEYRRNESNDAWVWRNQMTTLTGDDDE